MAEQFIFRKTALPGVLLVEPVVFGDDRGLFFEVYQEKVFVARGIPLFMQDNHSESAKRVIRGLHFQTNPHSQGKLVRVVSGEIFDVAVDIRPDSPTYKKWIGYRLSQENRLQLWVPQGFAHGFQVVSGSATVIYKVTGYRSAEHERCVRWDDPDIGIDWPLQRPILSPKDSSALSLAEVEHNFAYLPPLLE